MENHTRSAASTTHQAGLTAGPTVLPGLGGHAPPPDPYARLEPDPASQAQILRSHQRDVAQVGRLTELVSELLRSAAGTRWLAARQTIVDLAVRAVYLLLTFGRGYQTLGEEYTDVLPTVRARQLPPSRRRRLLTILLLLLPSALTSPMALNHLRGDGSPPTTAWGRFKARLVRFLESPLGQSLPEIHLVLFMFGGKFYEMGRRLTGLGYISAAAPRPPEARAPSYEPLGLLMALPLIYRLFPRPDPASASPPLTPTREKPKEKTLGGLAALPGTQGKDSVVVTSDVDYDEPNTYLTEEARDLPERQCTLCLESRGTGEGSGGTVAVTECGHIFCWGCLGGLDKPECPLCRQALRMERLVAAYNL
ncbi:peroxisome biogenesis factor 10 [Vanrija albida]|uniref:RING-type E3 ubiquitin transferase n=1 Tax=Vanrija albida TaxID=181172 RepID=A0ABR3Q6Q3_9TREE